MNLTWLQFKTLLQGMSNFYLQAIRLDDKWALAVANGPFFSYCNIEDSDNISKEDFELNWLSKANKNYNLAVDADGAQITNPKLAGEGTGYQATFLQFKTSDPNSMESYDWNFQPLPVASMKIYDATGNELAPENKAQAVCTVLTVAQTKTFYIQGFTIQQKTQPTEKVILCAAFAPHIPKRYGGCKEVIQGCDLRMAPYDKREIDWVGDSASEVKFDSNYFSHVMALKLMHPPGFEHHLQCEVIWYV